MIDGPRATPSGVVILSNSAIGDLRRKGAPLGQGSFLQRLRTSKPLHGPFSSSKRLMRILSARRRPTSWRSALPISFIAVG
jgi:hypothetical protein